uniref:stage II sporulation protein M n=1 Tax=Eubacterium sp. TaxID=142586 RepID=UPI0040257D1D
MKFSDNPEIKEFKNIKDFKNDKPKKSFYEIFTENRISVYCVIFYAAGLLCGALIYQKCATDSLDTVISKTTQGDFLSVLLNNLGFYFFVFAITVLLGLCLVGFPLINIIPFIIGFQGGMKVAFYYLGYDMKGFGYSLLMIAPFICLFLTVIILTINVSYTFSKQIFKNTLTKEPQQQVDCKHYLKKYLLYAAMTALIALINSGVSSALNSIISI